MYYRNNVHQRIFEEAIYGNPCKCTPAYLSAVYLLTGYRELWQISKYAIEKRTIDFDKINIKGITPNGYTLFKLAQDLYTGSMHLTLSDICDVHLRSESEFDMILTALRIRRDGYSYTGIQKVFS